MQPTFSSSRILQPVRPWFILFSLLVALLIDFLPTSAWPWMPDWVALDVADSSLMGQHALAYVLAAYAAAWLSRRILWFPLAQQALHVLPLLLMVQFVQFAVRAMPGLDFPGLIYFSGPFIGALLWLPLTFVLLLPQYQPVDRDANRPI
jgi:rod shape-determining protein MreD